MNYPLQNAFQKTPKFELRLLSVRLNISIGAKSGWGIITVYS